MHQLKKYDQFIAEKFLETRYSAGLAIVYDGMVLLGHPAGRSSRNAFGIPKGGIESGESHLDAAVRETEEEFGIKIPKSWVGKNEYTFIVTSRKYKFTKVVYYFIVKIDDLSQIGLKDIVVPKRQLQTEEIDFAKFMDRTEATEMAMLSQKTVVQNLIGLGLL